LNLNATIFENIWLADDDIDDCEVFDEAIKNVLPAASLLIIANGEELMRLLKSSKAPDLLFLDIKMPCKDGLDCLKEIRANKQFMRLPIIIYSSSTQPKQMDSSYGYGATLYYSKPDSVSGLVAGLGDLFKMNWNNPHTITADHYINNKYVAFMPPQSN
jgi:CheY-like chemotaxis protein